MLRATKKVLEYKLPIKVEPQRGGGFLVTCPIWPDCYAQGDTIDEAILEVTAVAQSLIELYKEEELEIPLEVQDKKDLTGPLSVPVIVTA